MTDKQKSIEELEAELKELAKPEPQPKTTSQATSQAKQPEPPDYLDLTRFPLTNEEKRDYGDFDQKHLERHVLFMRSLYKAAGIHPLGLGNNRKY
jgi:hypothetical protein